MVTSIKINNLRNNEYSQFLQNTLSVIDRSGPDKLMVQAEYDKLLALSTALKSLLNKEKGNSVTDELVALDARRDEAINGMVAIINGFTYHKDMAVKAAATLLKDHLESFGADIARESLQNETSKIQKIVADWTEKPELKAALTLLNLDDWKTELEEANTGFDNRYVERSVQKGTAAKGDKAYDKRMEAAVAWYDLRDGLKAWHRVKKGTEPWAAAVTAVNGVIKDYNGLLASRGERDGKSKGAGPDKPAA